mmetsp:Transcript_41281/g.95927  ORF Transcript_41281/g.95927 Transcript_41281/m.95927 type:complete len:108 (+) Transcript_41281:199-522(+)
MAKQWKSGDHVKESTHPKLTSTASTCIDLSPRFNQCLPPTALKLQSGHMTGLIIMSSSGSRHWTVQAPQWRKVTAGCNDSRPDGCSDLLRGKLQGLADSLWCRSTAS